MSVDIKVKCLTNVDYWILAFTLALGLQNVISTVMNNGHLSNYFNIQHGIRQGCPVSALLFVLIIEILAHQLQNNKLLHGVSVKTNNVLTEYKCFQYADDVNLFLQDEFQVDKALTIIDEN